MSQRAKRRSKQPTLGTDLWLFGGFFAVFLVLCITLVHNSGPYLEGLPGFVHFGVGVLPSIAMFTGFAIEPLSRSGHSGWAVRLVRSIYFLSLPAWIAVLFSTGTRTPLGRGTSVPAADWYRFGSDSVRHASDLRMWGCFAGLAVYIGFKIPGWVKKSNQSGTL